MPELGAPERCSQCSSVVHDFGVKERKNQNGGDSES